MTVLQRKASMQQIVPAIKLDNENIGGHRTQSHDIIQRQITQKRYKISIFYRFYIFSASGSQIILVFPYQTPWQ